MSVYDAVKEWEKSFDKTDYKKKAFAIISKVDGTNFDTLSTELDELNNEILKNLSQYVKAKVSEEDWEELVEEANGYSKYEYSDIGVSVGEYLEAECLWGIDLISSHVFSFMQLSSGRQAYFMENSFC